MVLRVLDYVEWHGASFGGLTGGEVHDFPAEVFGNATLCEHVVVEKVLVVGELSIGKSLVSRELEGFFVDFGGYEAIAINVGGEVFFILPHLRFIKFNLTSMNSIE